MIYLFDKDEKLIKIVRKSAIKTALQKYALTTERYVSDRLTVELKGLNADELEEVEYMAIQTMEDAHTFHYFYVAQKFSDSLTTLIGVQSGIEELRKSPVFDKRPKNAFARDVIADLLAGTNWKARFVGENTPHSTTFYYTSIFEALKKVCEVWDLEMQFFVEMNGNRIGARYIDFKQKIGEAIGKRVVYGHNALQILQEVERTNIFTALVGRGKGEETGNGYGRKITFENVVWSTTQGKPVNKPKGQKYLELPLMTRQYGIKNADGSMRPKIGFVDFSEEENPEVLIERTYKALVDAARPQLTLKTSSVYLRGVKVGDTIRVVRHDKKLDYDTRIFEITFNRLNNQSSDIKLGDRIGESNEAKVQAIADKAVEEFIDNEFSNFVQNLPDYLPSADGFNTNWYGDKDPTVQYPGKVLINDIWFKPDPEHEGHKIMLRFTGEVWEEILRTYDNEALKRKVEKRLEEAQNQYRVDKELQDQQVADIFSLAQAGHNLALESKSLAKRAKAESVAEANRLVERAKSVTDAKIQSVDINIDTIKNQLATKVSQMDFDAVTNRLTSAETSIVTQAGLIEQRLTRAQAEQLVSDKGFATTATVSNIVRETAESFNRTISETKSLIPTDFNGRNLVQNGAFPTQIDPWSGDVNVTRHDFYYRNGKTLFVIKTDQRRELFANTNRFELKRNTDYTLSFYGFMSWNVSSMDVYFLGRKNGESNEWTHANEIISSKRLSSDYSEYVTVTFNSGDNDNGYLRFDHNGSNDDRESYLFFAEVMLVEGGTAQKWEPAFEELVTETKFHDVRDTVDSHTRTIGDQAKAISQVVQTAQGLVTRVENLRSGGRNYLRQSKLVNLDLRNETGSGVFDLGYDIVPDFWQHNEVYHSGKIKLSLYYKPSVAYPTDRTFDVYFREAPWPWIGAITYPSNTTELRKYTFTVNWLPQGFSARQIFIRFSRELDRGRIHTVEKVNLEISDLYSDWSPAPEDAASEVQAVASRVSQLAGSWAVQNINSAGDIISGINLGANGYNRIDGRWTHITGETLIDNGTIKSAMIGNGQIGTAHIGTIDAGVANIINLNANKIVGLDANFIKAKMEFALVEWLKGKIISAQNNAMKINLNSGQILYYTDQAAMKRVLSGYPTQFIKFDTGTYSGAPAGVTVIGSNRDGNENPNNGSFAGIRIWNGFRSDGSFFDKMDIGADDVQIGHKVFDDGNGTYRGWQFRSYGDGSAVSLFPYGNYERATVTATNYRIKNLANNTYVNLEEVLDKIFDNFNNLNHNGNYQRSFYSGWR